MQNLAAALHLKWKEIAKAPLMHSLGAESPSFLHNCDISFRAIISNEVPSFQVSLPEVATKPEMIY